jgi:superoxide oxidase
MPVVPTVAPRFHPTRVALHWATVVLIVLTYAFIELRELFPRGTPERAFMRAAHQSLGLTVLALLPLRLAMAWRHRAPPISPPLPVWQSLLARVNHGVLLVFLLGMPLGGWVLLGLRDDPTPFYGLTLPALVAPDEALAKVVRGLHGDIGRIGYGLIALHALAALWHHHRRGDDTLRRMWPRRAAG